MSGDSSDNDSAAAEKTANTTQPGKKEWKTAPFIVKPGPNYGHRAGQSMKRWWPLHFFIFAAVTLLITLPVIYVGYPNISQGDVDGTDVSVDGLSLADPTQNAFTFGLNSTLRPNTSYKPVLRPFNLTLALAGAANPFIQVAFPEQHIQKPTVVNITNQRVQIENQAAWEDYLRAAFANETYNIHATGEPTLKLGGLPSTDVSFDKVLTVPGLNGLKQITTHNIRINTTTTTNNFLADVTVVNPSNSLFAVGNVTYGTYVQPNMTYVGDTHIADFTIAPGSNTYASVASTQQAPILAALGERPACATGMVETILVPKNVTYNGAVLDYYLRSLANVTQTLPLGQAIQNATNGVARFYCPPGV